jgi:hypothetical protein
VLGNYIGTDASGTAALGNAFGISVGGGADSNLIGDGTMGGRNVVAGNTQTQVSIAGQSSLSGSDPAEGNVVKGNYVGVASDGSALPYGVLGVAVVGGIAGVNGPAVDNVIGGTAAGEGNVIANQSGHGVRVIGPVATRNAVRGNSIYGNTQQGIDNLDGGNTELPPPTITSTTPVSGTTSCLDCTVDVYSDNDDEGRVYHGSTTASGGSWTYPGAVGVPNVTATVTDADGNTSEFSPWVACADANSNNICDGSEADFDGDAVPTAAEAACGSDPFNSASRPERTDGAFAGVSDDGDAEVDETLPASAAGFDCDGDGYTGAVEAGTPLCGNGLNDEGPPVSDDGVTDDGCPGGPPQAGALSEAAFNLGGTDQDPCGLLAWPSDFVSGGIPDSTNRVAITDLTSFLAPTRRLDRSPGQGGFDARWDLIPGKGTLASWVAINDLTALLAGASGSPPMLGGARAFNGPACPWPP